MIVHSEEDLSTWHRQWANFHVLLSMTKLGFFDLMADGEARSADQLAQALSADSRAIDICGRILVHAGLVNYQPGKFQLTETAMKLRVPLGELKLEWQRRENYASLLDTIRSGRPALKTSGGVLEENEADARAFLQKLYRHSATEVSEATKLIAQLCSSDKGHRPRILDLGGGHGRYSAAFAERLPGASVTLFDRPVVVKIARELSGEGFKTRSGDFLQDDLGGPYDLVFMAGIVSGIALDSVQRLLERVRDVTMPGGAVVIEDLFVDSGSNLYPESAIDFHLMLLLENEHGRFRTVPELSAILDAAGFPTHQHFGVEGRDFGFLVAR